MIRLVKECGKGRENMSKVEDFIAATKLNELVNKKEEDKHGKTQCTVSLHRTIWKILKKISKTILMMISSMTKIRYK